MSLNINQFKNSLISGGVRPNLFRVNGNIGNTPAPSELGFLIRTAALPETTLGQIEVPVPRSKTPNYQAVESTQSGHSPSSQMVTSRSVTLSSVG